MDGRSWPGARDPVSGSVLDLGSGSVLRLGGGPHAGLDGELADVRLYDRALEPDEIAALAVRPTA